MDGHAEGTRVLSDLVVIFAYLTLIAAALFHASVLLPQYPLGEPHRTLVLGVSVLLIVYSFWGIWKRLEWATTWG